MDFPHTPIVILLALVITTGLVATLELQSFRNLFKSSIIAEPNERLIISYLLSII